MEGLSEVQGTIFISVFKKKAAARSFKSDHREVGWRWSEFLMGIPIQSSQRPTKTSKNFFVLVQTSRGEGLKLNREDKKLECGGGGRGIGGPSGRTEGGVSPASERKSAKKAAQGDKTTWGG